MIDVAHPFISRDRIHAGDWRHIALLRHTEVRIGELVRIKGVVYTVICIECLAPTLIYVMLDRPLEVGAKREDLDTWENLGMGSFNAIVWHSD